MTRKLTAIIEREGDGYVALCPEVDVVSQGDTVAEARDNLEEALTTLERGCLDVVSAGLLTTSDRHAGRIAPRRVPTGPVTVVTFDS